MPEISRFYGIIIYIFYREHQPSHFHAVYGEYKALIAIDSLAVLHGSSTESFRACYWMGDYTPGRIKKSLAAGNRISEVE